VLYTLEILTT